MTKSLNFAFRSSNSTSQSEIRTQLQRELHQRRQLQIKFDNNTNCCASVQEQRIVIAHGPNMRSVSEVLHQPLLLLFLPPCPCACPCNIRNCCHSDEGAKRARERVEIGRLVTERCLRGSSSSSRRSRSMRRAVRMYSTIRARRFELLDDALSSRPTPKHLENKQNTQQARQAGRTKIIAGESTKATSMNFGLPTSFQ
jgi:hypothetical protein